MRKLTAKTLQDTVNDPERDVLVKFYAPWCGHCKAMKTPYMELVDHFEGNLTIVIAEIDATAHKIPSELPVKGYPTLLFWPAERGNETKNKEHPIAFQGRREVPDMAAFIERHSVSLQVMEEERKRADYLETLLAAEIAEEKYEEAAKLRDEIAAIRQKIAGNQLIVPGGQKEKKNRKPIFGKRIVEEALRKSKAEQGRKAKGIAAGSAKTA